MFIKSIWSPLIAVKDFTRFPNSWLIEVPISIDSAKKTLTGIQLGALYTDLDHDVVYNANDLNSSLLTQFKI